MDSDSFLTRDPDSNSMNTLADQQGFLVIPGDADEKDTSGQSYQIKVPGYTILEKIGRGGTSIVYRACVEHDSEEQYAVKIVFESVLNRTSLVRFNREIQSLAKLQHPAIAKLHDYGVGEDSCPFLILELIEGDRIDRYVEASRLSLEERVQLFIKVCHAVQHAHENGVLHRDLKPANILIDINGEPHLTDFGLAKFLGSDTPTFDKTRTGAVLGTLNYLAPEQVFNLDKSASPATDIFGLGAVMHSLLTGTPPMKFDNFVDAARDYFKRLPVEISEEHNVPANLEAICIKCLAPDPSLRYQSVNELVEELESFLDGDSVTAKTQKYIRKFSLLRRQYPWLIRTIAGVLLVSIAVAVVFFSLWRSSVDALVREEQTTKELKTLSLGLGEVANKIRFNNGSPEMLEERAELLGASSQLYKKLLQRFPDDPSLLFAAAQNHYKLARMQHHLGIRQAQARSYENARTYYERLFQQFPDHEEGRFGYFHVLMSVNDYERALEVIESLYLDFPGDEVYQSCTCSANLAIAQRKIGGQKFDEAAQYLAAGNKILREAAPMQEAETWFIDKSIQSNQLLTRIALNDGRLDDAQAYIGKAIEFCELRDPLQSGVVSYSVWYLHSLNFAFGIAAYVNDHAEAARLARKADEFYPLAQQRYKSFIELYEYRCAGLKSRAAFCLLNNNQQGYRSVDLKWQEALNQWEANSQSKNVDYLLAELEFASHPFLNSVNQQRVRDTLAELEEAMGESQSQFFLRGAALFRIGDLEASKRLLKSQLTSGPHAQSEAYLRLIELIETGAMGAVFESPLVDEQTKLTLLAAHQTYLVSQLERQLISDLGHYRATQ